MKKIIYLPLLLMCVMLCGLTAYAHQLEIKLDPDGGKCDKASIVYIYDTQESAPSIGELPVCTKEQYSFLGWKDENGYIVTKNTNILDINGTTLKAYYTLTEKQLIFNANEGTVTPESKTVYYNSAIGTMPSPTRSNYTFLGWYTQASGGILIDSNTVYMYKTNTTVYAHWKENSKSSSGESSGSTQTGSGSTSSGTTANTGKIKVSWGKISGATGYQIQYSTTKKFKKKNTTAVKIKGGKKTSYTIKKLVKKKKYYIRMRAYQTRKNKKTIYSGWSKTITKKAK